MSPRFLQLHLLTFYPPSNVNRDDTGRPKTAFVGGAQRLRISSQALKWAWRKSEVMEKALAGQLGTRTKKIGREVARTLVEKHGLPTDEARVIARVFAAVFGKPEDAPKLGQELFIRQLAFISPDEQDKLDVLLGRVLADVDQRNQLMKAAAEVALEEEGENADSGSEEEEGPRRKGKKPKQSKETTKLIKDLRAEVLAKADGAADIAMFGRMLADSPSYNREAAVQVAHAITTHRVTVEDDYFTAVDDLREPEDDMGAGFLDAANFGSGVFYLYLCVNRTRLVENLGNAALAGMAIGALVEAAATVTPSGKQNSFAAHARAGYALAELGDAQPRTLAGAFARPVPDREDVMAASVAALRAYRRQMDAVYGDGGVAAEEMVAAEGKGSLAGLLAFCRGDGAAPA